MDETALKARLDAAPQEAAAVGSQAVVPQKAASAETAAEKAVVAVPLPDGSFARISLEESAILSPELAARYPKIKTYRGQGIEDRSMTARLDYTPAGFHGMLISEKGTVYIDPLRGPDTGQYVSYWKRDLTPKEPFRCLVEAASAAETPREGFFNARRSPTNPSGTQLRTYRLAMTATGEYTRFFGNLNNCYAPGAPANCDVNAAAAQITTTVNRVTGIYEREVAVSFTLTAMRIFADPATDPFPTGYIVDENLLDQNQTELDMNVGSANYDIGHILSQGGDGGLTGFRNTCNNSTKARGGTSLGTPSGDAFDVDYVAHEIGHQMGATHTYNGTQGRCATGSRTASEAYEPGSGTTIMAYAGICGTDDVQPHSDDYFHTASFDEITAFRNDAETGGSCGAVTATGNTVPIVDAGPDYTIPTDTPFTLTPTGSDADGDALTFAWEQFDLGPAGVPSPTTINGPLFRSRSPTANPARTFPPLADLLAGTPTPWEVLPTVNRTLTFRVTVRDNHPKGGGVDYDSMVVTVAGNPFRISSPGTGDRLECGRPTTLRWDVGGGSVAANVRALLSFDEFNTVAVLIRSTANDGTETVILPPTLIGKNARIKLEPTDNIFFSISGTFSIEDTTPPTVTLPPDLTVACTSPAGASPTLGTATATDLCDTTLTIRNNAPRVFPLGTTTVVWTATDHSGNSGTANQAVTVVAGDACKASRYRPRRHGEESR